MKHRSGLQAVATDETQIFTDEARAASVEIVRRRYELATDNLLAQLRAYFLTQRREERKGAKGVLESLRLSALCAFALKTIDYRPRDKSLFLLSPAFFRSVFHLCFICGFLFFGSSAFAADRAAVVVVVGAPGTKEYGENFREWSARWESAAKQAAANFTAIGLADGESKTDRELLQDRLTALTAPSPEAVWLVLIGHGTFDGKTAKFNLRGPDVAPAELSAWLKPIERPLAILDCTSSSGPFLNALSGPNRVVVTAARSGAEYNYSRFGDFLSSAITDPKADLDKDEQTSLLEAFLFASSGVKEFYASEGRLATEHSLIDDNGDALGTPADWFQGLRATKTAKDGATPDGLRASQMVLVRSQREERLPPAIRARRDELERDLAALRGRKSKLTDDEYLALIEPILVELAKLYESAERPMSAVAAP